MNEQLPVELLNDAFNGFRDASRKLEEQYALLEDRIDELSQELAEKNRALERTRRLAAMGEMAARVAHEIRNPLGSMAIFATILERELGAEPEKQRLANHISTGIKSLDNLLSNMLLFASSPEAKLKPVDVRKVLEEALLLARGHEKEDVSVKAEFCGQTSIMADPVLLRQLFLNLIINAIDAMDRGGVLKVRTKVIDDRQRYMEIKFADTGRGIGKEHIDRVFDPFFSTKDRGTGLGLAIVSTVVNAHGGFIDVDSVKGEGTAFTIGLPMMREYRI
ncbi:Sensor protein ZraS [uncultured bacterium]|nr:Sensor protein ZraS [uncultured bacterium]